MNINFFVSYTRSDLRWAEWIAGVLEEAGYSTVLQAWDFRPGENFVERMDRAMRDSERTIAVLSRDYYRSAYAVPEWTHAVSQDPTGRLGVLLPVRVDDVVVEGIFRTVTWIDVSGKNAESARQALLEGVKRERIKPAQTPGFPEGERPRFPGALPPVWRVPYDRNPAFSGRDTSLSEMREALASAGKHPAAIALTGLGGIGKTALTVEYSYRAAADYQVVWFARAERREYLVSDLASMAEPLGLTHHEANDVEGRLADVLAWLQQHDQWLLVLDDAERAETLRGITPQGGGGHVILTSRNPAWRRYASRVFEVGVLETDYALNLLSERTGLPADEHARILTSHAGNLPLALELIGGFLEQQGLDYAEYLHRLEGSGGLPRARSNAPLDYKYTLQTVWAESLRVVEEQKPAAADLLRLCAFLAPDDVPRAVVSAGAALLPAALRASASDPDTLADLVALPRSYSLVSVHEDGVSLHRLLQTVLRDSMTPHAQREWAGAAARLMSNGFPVSAADTRLWNRAGRLLPHAAAATGFAEQFEVEIETAVRLLDRTATFLWSSKTQPEEAKSYRERAMALAKKHLPGDLPVWLLNNHGLWLLEGGDVAGARLLFDQAIAQEMKLHGESATLGTALLNTGLLLRDNGSIEEGLGYLRRAVAMLDRHVEQPQPNVATAHSHLGQALASLGEYEEAVREFERAVEIYTKTVGPGDLDTITAMAFLAQARSPGARPQTPFTVQTITAESVKRERGRALLNEQAYQSDAEEMLRAAVEGGDAHALFDLAQLLQKQTARKAEAAELMDRAVKAGVPEALYWRGRELADEPGKEAEAEQMIRRAIDARELYAWYDLGLLLSRRGAPQRSRGRVPKSDGRGTRRGAQRSGSSAAGVAGPRGRG